MVEPDILFPDKNANIHQTDLPVMDEEVPVHGNKCSCSSKLAVRSLESGVDYCFCSIDGRD